MKHDKAVRCEVSRAKGIHYPGVLHQDLRPDNIPWNAELSRVLIIDFHHSQLDRRPMKKRMRSPEKHVGRGDFVRSTIKTVWAPVFVAKICWNIISSHL